VGQTKASTNQKGRITSKASRSTETSTAGSGTSTAPPSSAPAEDRSFTARISRFNGRLDQLRQHDRLDIKGRRTCGQGGLNLGHHPPAQLISDHASRQSRDRQFLDVRTGAEEQAEEGPKCNGRVRSGSCAPSASSSRRRVLFALTPGSRDHETLGGIFAAPPAQAR